MTTNDEKMTVNLSQLRQTLISHFNKSELRHLVFDLGVEYEELAGSTKSDKALALIDYLRRRGRLPDLIKQCRQLRPNAHWSEIIGTESPPIPSDRVQLITPLRDNFSSYETGLDTLQACLGQTHPRYLEGLGYHNRLMENIDRARRHGDSENRRSERAEVLERLNELALSVTGKSFNDLCA